VAEVAEERCFLLKKMGGAIAQKGTFYYLYRVLPIGRVIAMVHVSHRGSVFESSRWCDDVIAMEWRGGAVGFTKRD
jgi:hypothetical protein